MYCYLSIFIITLFYINWNFSTQIKYMKYVKLQKNNSPVLATIIKIANIEV